MYGGRGRFARMILRYVGYVGYIGYIGYYCGLTSRLASMQSLPWSAKQALFDSWPPMSTATGWGGGVT
jgi:hypothetical protein